MVDSVLARERPFEGLTRENIEGFVVARLRAGGGTQPALLLIEDGGSRAVVKDYLPCSWLLRAIFGPWLIGREEAIYRLLEGARGVPRLVGRLDRTALVVEHIEGRNCAAFPPGGLPGELFERLGEVVEGIHARGVVHCDIKNRSNVVVTEDLQPYVVDFASAFTREGRGGFLRRYAFERFRLDDQRAVVKARLLVARIGDERDRRFVYHRGPAERVVRAIRDAVRWAFQAIARR
jgi:hypothetical protein